ncbi:MAG TPA: MurR/RpiR family transcriptional regulator [Candidatus Limnocylindria bacterium]|nr:MurR/RpiR family transcriptional regulator [Candidatus Limnocylindria bacterium]
MTNQRDPFEILKRRFADLSEGQRRVARMLLDEPARVALLSTAALGERAGVSDSTVIRLASALGYSGYPELRAAIHNSLFTHVAPSEYFRRSLHHDAGSAAHASLKADANNIARLEAQATHRAVTSAAGVIATAESVFVAGSESSFAPAYALAYLLARVRRNVQLFGSGETDVARQLLELGPTSALVVFSVPRYARATYQVAEHAVRAGAHLIAVTDSLTAPIAQLKSTAITVDSASASFFQSQVASISVANALAAEVAHRSAADAEQRLRAIESLDESSGRFLVGRESSGRASSTSRANGNGRGAGSR